MLTLIALSALLMQDPAATPAAPEVRTRVFVAGPDGPGSMDRDGDGQVTREEFAAPLNDHFTRLDKDGDGRLSSDELKGAHGPDGEHDVMIMRSPGGEGEHRLEVRTLGEGAAWTSREGGRTAVFIGGEPGPGGEREIVVRGPGHGPGGPRVMQLPGGGEWTGDGERRIEVVTIDGDGGKAELDKDGDGKVSEAEFTAPLREAFARMDADHSGFIEEGERRGEHNVHVFTHRVETREESDQ